MQFIAQVILTLVFLYFFFSAFGFWGSIGVVVLFALMGIANKGR